jgi:tetratricopeptide (TPR) repeat protein
VLFVQLSGKENGVNRVTLDLFHSCISLALSGKNSGAEFMQAVRLETPYASGHHNLANVLLKQGKYTEAEAAYKLALSLALTTRYTRKA